MSVIRTGSNKQYAEGWEKVFGGKTAKKKAVKKAAPKKATKKKSAKKAAKKK